MPQLPTPEKITADIQANPTIFGKILRGEIPCAKVYEDDYVLAFNDIFPKAKVHVLLIPKMRFESLQTVSAEDAPMLGHFLAAIPKVAELAGCKEEGFRVIMNNGANSGQEVPHLHAHILGGERLGAMIGG